MEQDKSPLDSKMHWFYWHHNLPFIILGCLVALLIFSVAFFLLVFPFILVASPSLQARTIFTAAGSSDSKNYQELCKMLGFHNMYFTFLDSCGKTIKLGIWHILPSDLTKDRTVSDEESERLLRKSNYSILLYFHGVGQTREDFLTKYNILRQHFHVIAFDYRCYGDTTNTDISEQLIVGDAIELFKWLKNKTKSSIYIWGHSLGSALCAETVSYLARERIIPKGVFLESAFTRMRDEIPASPVGKLFSWLPWFYVVLDSYEANGFVFDTAKHILNIECPIMFLHARDDEKVPFALGARLYGIAANKGYPGNILKFLAIDSSYECGHNFIYTYPNLSIHIEEFLEICNRRRKEC